MIPWRFCTTVIILLWLTRMDHRKGRLLQFCVHCFYGKPNQKCHQVQKIYKSFLVIENPRFDLSVTRGLYFEPITLLFIQTPLFLSRSHCGDITNNYSIQSLYIKWLAQNIHVSNQLNDYYMLGNPMYTPPPSTNCRIFLVL